MIHLNRLVLLFNQISHKSASICINKVLLYTQSFNTFLLLERFFMFHWLLSIQYYVTQIYMLINDIFILPLIDFHINN